MRKLSVLRLDVNGDAVETAAPEHWTLLEVLRYMPTDEVRLTFKAPERAATIEPEGWSEPGKYLCLVMPLRLVD